MPAGEKGNQDLADDALLPDDGLGQLALEPPGHLGDGSNRVAWGASLSAKCDQPCEQRDLWACLQSTTTVAAGPTIVCRADPRALVDANV